MKTFVAACLFSAYRRYLCIFSLKIYIFSLKIHIFKLKIEIFSLAFPFFSGMFLLIYPDEKERVRGAILKKVRKKAEEAQGHCVFIAIFVHYLSKQREKMKRIIFMLAVMMLSIGLAAAQQKQAVISAKETSYDFGTIQEADGKVAHTFVIDNTGTGPLVITRVIASCGCTTPEWTKEPIAPGKSGEVKITYNPANRPGAFVKTISLYSNGKKGSFILTIKGKVVGK